MYENSGPDDDVIDAEVDHATEDPPPALATSREAGAACPGCGGMIAEGVEIVVCRTCGKSHHAACWRRSSGCATYSCAPFQRTVGTGESRLVISDDELNRAVPIVARKPTNGVSFPAFEQRPRLSKLALAAFITALAGIPFFGIVTGPVAMLLAALALAGLQGKKKGLVLALLGLVIGIADVVGWIIFLNNRLNGPVVEAGVQEFDGADMAELKSVQPELFRAMQANVLVQHRAGWLGEASGSGVVLQVEGGDAIVVTNRHVIDGDFPGRKDAPDLEKLGSGSLRVSFFGREPAKAQVLWVAPDGVDLALLRVPMTGTPVEPAPWQPNHLPRVGEHVYAIGNPLNHNWSYTSGVVSQLRTMPVGGQRLRVIQTQASVNPGNSGGGLYDERGLLVGIVTWTRDKRVSEGLGFAIALDALIDLAPPDLLKPPPRAEAEKP